MNKISVKALRRVFDRLPDDVLIEMTSEGFFVKLPVNNFERSVAYVRHGETAVGWMDRSIMNVYPMVDGCMWYVGPSYRACVIQQCEDEGRTPTPDELDADVKPLTDAELAALAYHYDDPHDTVGTFAEKLAEVRDECTEFPAVFATTEF